MDLRSVMICAGDVRCSGLLFNKDWILTHGSLLGNFSLEELSSVSSSLSLPTIKLPRVFVVLEVGDERPAQWAGFWRCPLVAGAVDKLLNGWMFGDGDKDDNPKLTKTLLPLFVLLRLGDPALPQLSVNNVKAQPSLRLSDTEAGRDALANLFRYVGMLPPLARGQTLMVKSTPFGSQFFFDSWSNGVVSSIGGPQGCVLLTDARSAPGSEGGVIIRQGFGAGLVGLVLSSLCWWRGEWVGFTLGAVLQPVLWQLRAGNLAPNSSLLTLPSGIPANVDNGVVLVRCGGTWGSGVVLDVDDGIVLTCSHVLRQAFRSPITIYHQNRTFKGEMVHRTRDGVPFDVGIVKVGPNSHLKKITLAETPPVKGEPVLAAGFPLISDVENPFLLPVVTRGHVSHVAPTMVQTTCCIQSGASGGAILRPSGELLALVVCNARDQTSNAIYPHINLCVQVAAVISVLRRYLLSKDPAVLRDLECKDVEIQRLWALKLTPASKL
ncbi:peroxisomal leader peptide-processing protease [Anabrus simplex]|uniref:peroxisomal leader peptide-processing protease n=1 Tax=Anabrus simplex TaxID=316456 RepID=UPI0035A32DAD